MTEEQRDKAIQTGYLQLGNWEKINHFSIVLFCCFISFGLPVIHLVKFLQGNGTSFKDDEIWIVTIPFVLAILFYWLQKSRLKFEVVNTQLEWSRIVAIIQSIGRERQWRKMLSTGEVFTAKTPHVRWSTNYGEQITVIYDDGRVLINSICDLDERNAIASMGSNRDNMNILMDRIKEVKVSD